MRYCLSCRHLTHQGGLFMATTDNAIMSEPILIGAKEVCQLLGIKISRAYAIIRQLNQKLKDQGKITIAGKINKEYLIDNFCFIKEEK